MKTLILLIAFIQLGCSSLSPRKTHTLELKVPDYNKKEVEKTSDKIGKFIEQRCGDGEYREEYVDIYKNKILYMKVKITCI